MAHFMGTVKGASGEASRLGGKESGLCTYAAGWGGAIRVAIWCDDSGVDRFRIEQVEWKGRGDYNCVAEGILGVHLDDVSVPKDDLK